MFNPPPRHRQRRDEEPLAPSTPASENLTRLQAKYTSKVEAFILKRSRFEVAKEPETVAELGVLLPARVDRIADAME